MSALSQLKLSDANSSSHTHQVLNQLMSAMPQLLQNVSQLQQNDANSSNRTDHVLNQLMTNNSQLQTAISQLQTHNTQLQRDLADVKAAITHRDVTGKLGNEKNVKAGTKAHSDVMRSIHINFVCHLNRIDF